MGFAPLPHPLDVFGVAKVISVGGFSQPASLALGFARPAAISRQTKILAAGVMNVRSEEALAAAALASNVLGTHLPTSGKKTNPSKQSKNSRGRREKTKKEE